MARRETNPSYYIMSTQFTANKLRQSLKTLPKYNVVVLHGNVYVSNDETALTKKVSFNDLGELNNFVASL